MTRRIADCARGRHIPGRDIELASRDAAQRHARCRSCGQLLVKSPVTGRWRMTGMLGWPGDEVCSALSIRRNCP